MKKKEKELKIVVACENEKDDLKEFIKIFSQLGLDILCAPKLEFILEDIIYDDVIETSMERCKIMNKSMLSMGDEYKFIVITDASKRTKIFDVTYIHQYEYAISAYFPNTSSPVSMHNLYIIDGSYDLPLSEQSNCRLHENKQELLILMRDNVFKKILNK